MPGRGNGRHAASYSPLVDLDPQLADAVLHMLADEGIAAYAVPVSDHRTLTDLPGRLVDRPLDRVYVDRAATANARRVVDAHLPELVAELESGRGDAERTGAPVDRPDDGRADGMPGEDRAPSSRGLDEDEAWAQILAAYDQTAPDPVPRWPVAEDLPGPEDDRRRGRLLRAASFDDLTAPVDDDAEGETDDRRRGEDPHADEPASPPTTHRQYTPPAEPEEHFVPPPPPPLNLPADPVSRAAWIGVIGGPLIFLLATLLSWRLDGWMALLAVVGFVGGFVTLVARMKDRPPPEDGGDNGAVV
jgi:hypothetical protein